MADEVMDLEELLTERISWLKQKLDAQRDPESLDYTSNKQLIGRLEGNIGSLEWVLRQLKAARAK